MSSVPDGYAVRLTRLGRTQFGTGRDALAAWVPERATHRYGLHPGNWRDTFWELTMRDPERIGYYCPTLIEIVAGTLIADMHFASRFYWYAREADAEAYKSTVRPFKLSLLTAYQKPELLIPPP